MYQYMNAVVVIMHKKSLIYYTKCGNYQLFSFDMMRCIDDTIYNYIHKSRITIMNQVIHRHTHALPLLLPQTSQLLLI